MVSALERFVISKGLEQRKAPPDYLGEEHSGQSQCKGPEEEMSKKSNKIGENRVDE